MRLLKTLFLCISIFLFCACPERVTDLCLENNYGKKVRINFLDDWSITHGYYKNDTSITWLEKEYLEIVFPEGKHITVGWGGDYADWFSVFPNDTLRIFFFDNELVNCTPWEEIVSGYRILRRYDLSVQDMKTLKGDSYGITIPFPPTEVMKDMRMWPPYGQPNNPDGMK